MSKVIETTDAAELKSTITANDVVVVDFQAPAWCVPCIRFAPHFEAAANASEAKFVAVDVDNAPWAMVEYGVQAVPTVMLFKNGHFVRDLRSRTAILLLGEIADV